VWVWINCERGDGMITSPTVTGVCQFRSWGWGQIPLGASEVKLLCVSWLPVRQHQSRGDVQSTRFTAHRRRVTDFGLLTQEIGCELRASYACPPVGFNSLGATTSDSPSPRPGLDHYYGRLLRGRLTVGG
jgi:hypothetical protein